VYDVKLENVCNDVFQHIYQVVYGRNICASRNLHAAVYKGYALVKDVLRRASYKLVVKSLPLILAVRRLLSNGALNICIDSQYQEAEGREGGTRFDSHEEGRKKKGWSAMDVPRSRTHVSTDRTASS